MGTKFVGESKTTTKNLNITRWSRRFQSILALKLRFSDYISKKDKKAEGANLKKKMATFECVFTIVLMFKIMNEISLAPKVLQKKNIDLHQATNALKLEAGDLAKK